MAHFLFAGNSLHFKCIMIIFLQKMVLQSKEFRVNSKSNRAYLPWMPTTFNQYRGIEHMTYNFPNSSTDQGFIQNMHGEPIWKVPSSLTSFVGRECEIQQICLLVRRSDLRLLTLIGTGGVGKTRLSMQVAQKLKGHFAAGIYFVSLSSLHSSDQVSDTLAHGLGLTKKDNCSPLELVKQF